MSKRLITVTRQDLSSGYQTVQTAHAVADFAIRYPIRFIKWRLFGRYLISLATTDKDSLEGLMKALDNLGVKFASFYEEDVKEVTAIAIQPHKLADQLTKELPLANRVVGTKDKDNE